MSTPRMIESPAQRRRLLEWARASAELVLLKGKAPPVDRPAIEGRFGGVFVTFWSRKRLRGCVGTFAATTDIVATVADVTRTSLKDVRFAANPITARELAGLEIEISILSDPAVTNDPASLVPGRHGIIVRRLGRSGCFLPKVASERNWSAEEFLSECCTTKAGLEADAWRKPDTTVLLFTADAFSESDPG